MRQGDYGATARLQSCPDAPGAATLHAAMMFRDNCFSHLASRREKQIPLALAHPERPLRDQLMDRVSELDSIADVMRQALDALR